MSIIIRGLNTKTKKIWTFLLTFIILSNFTIIAFGTTNIQLEGEIKAILNDETYGSVCPNINITDNQTIYFNATKDGNNNYLINHTLTFDLNIIKNESQEYILGRYLNIAFIILRLNGESVEDNLFSSTLSSRIIWSLRRLNVLTDNTSKINITLDYKTKNYYEEAIVYAFALGSFGNVFSCPDPVFTFKTLQLNFVYDENIQNDTSPPITNCILEGEQT